MNCFIKCFATFTISIIILSLRGGLLVWVLFFTLSFFCVLLPPIGTSMTFCVMVGWLCFIWPTFYGRGVFSLAYEKWAFGVDFLTKVLRQGPNRQLNSSGIAVLMTLLTSIFFLWGFRRGVWAPGPRAPWLPGGAQSYWGPQAPGVPVLQILGPTTIVSYGSMHIQWAWSCPGRFL